MGRFKGVSLPEELVKAIKDYIESNPSTGYKSIADFVVDAIRLRLEQLGALPPTFSLIHINTNENYALFWEEKPGGKPGGKTGHTVRVFFKDDQIKCEYCDSIRCIHIKKAIKLPEVQEALEKRKKAGLKIPDLSYLED